MQLHIKTDYDSIDYNIHVTMSKLFFANHHCIWTGSFDTFILNAEQVIYSVTIGMLVCLKRNGVECFETT